MQKYFITGQNALMVPGEPPTDEYDVVYYADDVDARIAELMRVLECIRDATARDSLYENVAIHNTAEQALRSSDALPSV